MCGIAGIVDKCGRLGPEAVGSLAERMADAMDHRGPDDSGVWTSLDGRLGLSHRRLSILDTTTAAHQPMRSRSGRTHIVYNGELYNYRELRAELERNGSVFQSTGDTEVLLAALEHEGLSVLGRLDGMFAFACFDERSRDLMLARDRFGEKPLYYMDTPELFAFASELQPLTIIPGFYPKIDADTIASYLAFQYVPAPNTIYSGIKKLPPGSSLVLRLDGSLVTQRYYAFRPGRASAPLRTLSAAGDALEEILVRAVESRLVSDVPLGAFLSGGVDSSTVVALASRVLRRPVQTFTIGFDGAPESEHVEAAEMARHIGTEHHERLLLPDGVRMCETIASQLDEPNADTSCLPTYLLSAFARETVTVAVSGDGGDELFGGYGRYLASVEESEQKIYGNMEWWTPGAAYWSSRILVFPEDELAILTGRVPTALTEEIDGLRERLDGDVRPLIHRMREVDAIHYMPGAVLAKVDRMSMQHSLEVRAPFLAREVAAFAETLSEDECILQGQGKAVLREVARRYFPDEFLRRPKRGFGLPMGLWGASVLLPAAHRLLLADESRLSSFIPRGQLVAYLDRMSLQFGAYRVWSLIILELWLRSHPHIVGSAFTDIVSGHAPARTSGMLRGIAARGRRWMHWLR